MVTFLYIGNDTKYQAQLKTYLNQIAVGHSQVLATLYLQNALNYIDLFHIRALFIDYEACNPDTIQIAEAIRSRSDYYFTPIIVRGKSTWDMVEECGKIHPYQYLTIPVDTAKLKKIVEEMTYGYAQLVQPPSMQIKYKHIQHQIPFDEIIYIERNSRVFIHTTKECIPYRITTLNKVEMLLDRRFKRVHQSYIVNTHHIYRVDYKRNLITLHGQDQSLPLDMSYKDSLDGVFI